MSEPRIVIAGGGTGGHIFPAIAIAQAIQRKAPGADLLFIGAKDRMEMEKIPQAGYKIKGLDIAGFNRSNWLKNLFLPLKILKSLSEAKQILKEFSPSAAVGVGGYASFPMLKAAQQMNIPTIIQEQNSYAGKSNKILGRKARLVCVAYKNMDKFFPKAKLLLTGNPVRKSIAKSALTPQEGLQHFGLFTGRKTLLIVGGSLGAQSINEAVSEHLDELLSWDIQIIWQTGKPYYETAKKHAADNTHVKVYDFIKEMDYAYAAADVIISRAGALAIAELCIVAKPVIFVPYPFAAEDHQTKNAMALVEHNAAEIVPNNEAKTLLKTKLKDLLNDEVAQEVMRKNLKALAIVDADDRIAEKVLELSKTAHR